MKQKKREVLPGLPHHVWTRGNNRRRIFSRRDDYQRYLWQMSVALREFPILVHALCLMSNHLHLLVTPATEDSLWKFMKRINQRYAQIRNHRKNGSGKLFEQGFESEPVKTELYLATATMYIDANPDRAGLRSGAHDYSWSIAPHRLGSPERSGVHPALWTPSVWYLGLGETPTARIEAYRAAFARYLREPVLPEHVAKRRVLERVEQISVDKYEQRLRRPDGSSARESNSWQWAQITQQFRDDEG
jgi:putative transposase